MRKTFLDRMFSQKIDIIFVLLAIISVVAETTANSAEIKINSGIKNDINTTSLKAVGGINIIGALEISSGTITINGYWLNSGLFTHGSSTVILNGTNQTISGNTTFYNLTKITSTADTLTFGSGTTQSIVNSLALNGASGNLLSLRSNSSPNQFGLIVQSGGIFSLSFLDVKDSNASGGLQLVPANSVDSGNNTNWLFRVPPPPPPPEEERRPIPTLTPTPTPIRINSPPIANAGPDQMVHVGNMVKLDGSGSSDPDMNLPLSFAWSFVSRPVDSLAVFSNPNISTPFLYLILLIIT